MPILKLREIVRGIIGTSNSNPVNVIAQRFLYAFNEHGVQTTQIPRLLTELKLDDLKSEEALLAALSPEILDKTARLFGIRVEWLEGVDEEIYDKLYCYKRPELLLEHLKKIVDGADEELGFPLRVFATTKKLNFQDDSVQLLAPVIVEKIAELGEEDICRFHIFHDEFDWGYFPTRIELKVITRIVDKQLHTPVPLFIISEKEMRDLLDGKLIPTNLFRSALITNPSMEDFALSKEESLVAKEVEEMPEVLRYIDEHRLERFTFDAIALGNPPPDLVAAPSVRENAAKAAQARHAKTNAILRQFISFHEENDGKYSSREKAAIEFYGSLDEIQKSQYKNGAAAVQTLLAGLRKHIKSKKS